MTEGGGMRDSAAAPQQHLLVATGGSAGVTTLVTGAMLWQQYSFNN